MPQSQRAVKALKVLTAVLVVVVLSETANAIALGYITGNDYLKLSKQEQIHWFVGVIDGLTAEQIFSPNSRTTSTTEDEKNDPLDPPWISKCMSQFPIEQLHAIFEKELKAEPERWHVPAALVARSSLKEMCAKDR